MPSPASPGASTTIASIASIATVAGRDASTPSHPHAALLDPVQVARRRRRRRAFVAQVKRRSRAATTSTTSITSTNPGATSASASSSQADAHVQAHAARRRATLVGTIQDACPTRTLPCTVPPPVPSLPPAPPPPPPTEHVPDATSTLPAHPIVTRRALAEQSPIDLAFVPCTQCTPEAQADRRACASLRTVSSAWSARASSIGTSTKPTITKPEESRTAISQATRNLMDLAMSPALAHHSATPKGHRRSQSVAHTAVAPTPNPTFLLPPPTMTTDATTTTQPFHSSVSSTNAQVGPHTYPPTASYVHCPTRKIRPRARTVGSVPSLPPLPEAQNERSPVRDPLKVASSSPLVGGASIQNDPEPCCGMSVPGGLDYTTTTTNDVDTAYLPNQRRKSPSSVALWTRKHRDVPGPAATSPHRPLPLPPSPATRVPAPKTTQYKLSPLSPPPNLPLPPLPSHRRRSDPPHLGQHTRIDPEPTMLDVGLA